MATASFATWAQDEFEATDLGDVRRTRRLVAMAEGAARRPSGKVSEVFDRARDREGAYDLLESPHVSAAAIAESVFRATASRADASAIVYVAVDGTSLALTDDNGAKGFGSIGSGKRDASGLAVISALAVARNGTPLGLIDQMFWSRPPKERVSRIDQIRRNERRSFEDKETFKFVEAATNASKRLDAIGARAWIIIDREGDNQDILLALHKENCLFTIRARGDRPLWRSDRRVEEELDAEPCLGTFEVEVGRTGRRAARVANVEVHAGQVMLSFRYNATHGMRGLRLYAVRVRERTSEKDALDWLLFTNAPVLSFEHARAVIDSYRARWRIEEFHRTWKQGTCNVEDAQLRSQSAVVKWATLLAAVATRIERLKHLSRNKPDEPASCELTAEEIEALQLDQQRRSERKATRSQMPTIGEATTWLAELGGWIGVRNGPPGATVLSRGLERLAYLVEGIALARKGAGT